MTPSTTVDARGLRCPLPLVMTKLWIEQVASGEQVTVMATDPEAGVDLAAWAADEGHVLEERPGPDWTEFVVRKGG